MSLRIYLDDCAFSHRLRQLLLQAGHSVQVPADVSPPLTGARDEAHFVHVRATGSLLFTYNPQDFLQLHKQFPKHPGILAVYQDNNPEKDMSYVEIVQAIHNLEQLQVELNDEFWILNRFRW